MITITDKTKCSGCSACANICPKHCITMLPDDEGFLYPSVDKTKCIDCKICEKVCPFLKEGDLRKSKPESYGVSIKEDTIRNESSSGGVFSALAIFVLQQGGVVYGCSMSDDMRSAIHIRVDSIEGLDKLRGSKYLQSTIGNIYYQVKVDLRSGKKVLFSGVPCQINGLKNYLGEEYQNLICVEVICHGTPSPALWKKYIDYLESKYNASVEFVNFRHKKNGWRGFGLFFEGPRIKQYKSLHDDPYLIMFLRDICLRPSCYKCKAKEFESMADLTIADLWGVHEYAPELYDDKGMSLVLIQSKKGQQIFIEIQEELKSKEVPFDQAIKWNPSYCSSVNRPKERDVFFKDMNVYSFKNLQKKYVNIPLKVKIKRIIKKTFIWKLLTKWRRGGG